MAYSPVWFNKQSSGSARALDSNYQNASGSTLLKGTPVTINASGQLVLVDVSDEAAVKAMVGYAGLDLPNAASGSVIDAGRLENITTSFAVRDVVYIGKDGLLTNIEPDIGVNGFVAGDFVVLAGVIVKNEFNPAWKDLKIMTDTIGQL